MQLDDEVNLSKSYEFESYCTNYTRNQFKGFLFSREKFEDEYKKTHSSSEKKDSNVADVIHAVKDSVSELCNKHDFQQQIVVEDAKHIMKIQNLVLNIELDRNNKTISISSSRYLYLREDEKDMASLLQFSFDEYEFFLWFIEQFFIDFEGIYNHGFMEEKDAVAAMELIKTTIGKADIMLLELKNNYFESEIQFVKDNIQYSLITLNKAVLADSKQLIDFLNNPKETLIKYYLKSGILHKGYGMHK